VFTGHTMLIMSSLNASHHIFFMILYNNQDLRELYCKLGLNVCVVGAGTPAGP